MNYIYDIYLNLNKTLYDFYDWDKSDRLIRIKKIPIFIVDTDTYNCITFNDIKIEKEFINKIRNLTETWSSNSNLICALFSDKSNITAINFDVNGKSIQKSFLYIDEELEILEEIEDNTITNISFELLSKTPYLLNTRKQNKIDLFIESELKKIDSKRLDYVCYECLGKKSSNKIEDLKNLKRNSKNYKNLYDILKLTSNGSN